LFYRFPQGLLNQFGAVIVDNKGINLLAISFRLWPFFGS
jgi:hypothetical protein